MVAKKIETVTLWRENKVDQEWTVTVEQLATDFHPWRSRTDGADKIPFERALLDFLAVPDGYHSVFEVDAEALFDSVYPAYATVRDQGAPR